MRRLRFLLPAFATTLVLAAPAPAAQASCHGTSLRPSPSNLSKVRSATLCLLNRERARHGLPKLRRQHALGRAAGSYARLMVRQGFFAHISPGGSTMEQRIRRTSYLRGARSWSIGENLAWGAGRNGSARSIVAAWMRSPGHRANILNGRFTEIGIGLAPGVPSRVRAAGGAGTFVTEFGTRR
jgi:uncharacterized protein YkwD